MALASGLASQIGFAIESSYGTATTPAAFLPLVSESMTHKRDRLESSGIIAGRRILASNQWNGGNITTAGDLSLELYNRGLGKLFTVMFGNVTTTGAGPYTHTFTPGDLLGDSLTVQVGRPSVDGTVNPFTYTGMKVMSWDLSCNVGEIAKLKLTFAGQNETVSRTVSDGVTTSSNTSVTSATASFASDDVGKPISGTGIAANTTIASVTNATTIVLSQNATATGTSVALTIGVPLASATYPSTIKPLKFNHAALTVAGSTIKAKGFTLSGNNALADDRRYLGQQTISEPLEKDLRNYDGSLDLEFTDLTQYRRYLQASEVALVISFTSGADSVTITTNVRLDGETPVVAGRDILKQKVGFKAIGSSTDASAVTAVLVNSDSTP
ncbi:hypothetical protein UFOVP209_25 [uncultured Caudovirales phage]|uniref:Uncharacterized protein n=1 Tax=uncultured Caudovirales phage TaxID=2100421 RepID=A0A6J7WJE6_9CAUD|nr:hypothetical protein UFOVP209_25 [uncultured Caudovirales phage]